jgi:hypothetical protein
MSHIPNAWLELDANKSAMKNQCAERRITDESHFLLMGSASLSMLTSWKGPGQQLQSLGFLSRLLPGEYAAGFVGETAAPSFCGGWESVLKS